MEKRNLKTIEIIRPVFLEKGIGLSEAERIKKLITTKQENT